MSDFWSVINEEFGRAAEVDKIQLQQTQGLAQQVLQKYQIDNERLSRELQSSQNVLGHLMNMIQHEEGIRQFGMSHELDKQRTQIEKEHGERRLRLEEMPKEHQLFEQQTQVELLEALLENPERHREQLKEYAEAIGVTDPSLDVITSELRKYVDTHTKTMLGPKGTPYRFLPFTEQLKSDRTEDPDEYVRKLMTKHGIELTKTDKTLGLFGGKERFVLKPHQAKKLYEEGHQKMLEGYSHPIFVKEESGALTPVSNYFGSNVIFNDALRKEGWEKPVFSDEKFSRPVLETLREQTREYGQPF